MSRALVALVLSFALSGSPPLQWAASLIEAVLSASASPDYGSQWDPNGSQPTSDYGGQWDPNG